MPSSIDETVAILDSTGHVGSSVDEASRRRLRDAARRMLHRLQTPFERAWEIALEEPAIFATLQIGLDLGLFEAWRSAGGNESTLADLLKMCNRECEANLLRRLLRLLSISDVVVETGEDQWKPTPFSLELGKPDGHVEWTIKCGTHHMLESNRNLPGFLAKTGYREPLDDNKGNYRDARADGLDFFGRCASDPQFQSSFIKGVMAGLTTYKAKWTTVFDTEPLVKGYLERGDARSHVCVVDAGGAHGFDMMSMLAKHPDLPAGSLVVQDRPEVLALADMDPKIQTMAYDFFTSQPIKGSRAYFVHAVLHDWNDADAARILGKVAFAMERGYSKLLIYENVIPPQGASALQAVLDISLMLAVSAAERSEAAWNRLLEQCGLKIVKIWRHPLAIESVIEAELA